MIRTDLSNNWAWFEPAEFLLSSTARDEGIYNVPTDFKVWQNLDSLVTLLLDPLRDFCGYTIRINSGYRHPELNRLLGGVKNSQHMTGEAADIYAFSNNQAVFNYIKQRYDFDQLIEYNGYAWLHVSLAADGNNRKEVWHKDRRGVWTREGIRTKE